MIFIAESGVQGDVVVSQGSQETAERCGRESNAEKLSRQFTGEERVSGVLINRGTRP